MLTTANALHHDDFKTLKGKYSAAMFIALAFGCASPTLIAADHSNHTTNDQLSISVAAGPLAEALSNFAQKTSINLSFSPAEVSGLSSNGVRNAQSIDAALSNLLIGTGLAAQKSSNGYVVAAAQTNDTEAYKLDTQIIKAERNKAAVAPISGYYAPTNRSATKTDTPLLETAQSISVITSDQIANRKANSVEEAVAC